MRLTVEIDAAVVETRYREVLDAFRRDARLPGFREGKAPQDLVEKKYSKEAEEETLKSLVPEVYHQAVASEELTPISLPSVTDIRFARGQKLSFTAEFESAPEFSLKNYKGLRLKKVPVDVTPEDVDKGIESLRQSRAELVPVLEPRGVRQGDFLVSDIEIWQEGAYVPGKKGALLYAEPGGPDDFYEQVLGAQANDVKEITAEPSPEERASGLVGRKPAYRILIRAIQEKRLPALDDELAKAFGQENVEALREAIRKDLARHKTGESQNRMKNELFEKLLGLVSFPLPESLVEKQKERLIQQAAEQARRMGVPPDRLEAQLAAVRQDAAAKAAEQVKLYFLLQKVAELEKIDVDETELEGRLRALAEESKRPVDEVRRVFEEDLRESLLERRTIEFLLANAKFDEKQ